MTKRESFVPVAAEEEPNGKPYLQYSGQKTIKSYQDNKLEVPEFPGPTGTDEPERFLYEVHPKTKPIQRVIRVMIRQKNRQPDPNSKTGVKKMKLGEYLVYYEDWYGVNYLGAKIAPATSVVQGMWHEQEKEQETQLDDRTGVRRVVGYYRKAEYPICDIPFNKKTVDDIIDEVDGDKYDIKYYAKFGTDSHYTSIRNGDYTYEQFTNLTFEELYKLASQPGGPQGRSIPPPAAKLGDGVG